MKAVQFVTSGREEEKTMDTGIRTDRIERIRDIVSSYLEKIGDPFFRAEGYVHMFGVAQAAVFLALKRGEDAELAACAGYLHDIATYTTGDSAGHAARGAEMAERILQLTGLFSEKEISKITSAIRCHSDKKNEDGPLEEILKDADVVQHCLYDPGYVSKKDKERYRKLRKELGIGK